LGMGSDVSDSQDDDSLSSRTMDTLLFGWGRAYG